MRSSKHTIHSVGLLGLAISLLASPASAAICAPGDSPVSCHSLAPTAEQAKGGGAPLAIDGYPPLGVHAGAITLPAKNANTHASDPGLVTEASAGAWGSAGREPIAVASIRYELKPADGLLYLNKSDSGYSFSCAPATDGLCFGDTSVVRTGRATLKRRYRVVSAPGAQLPADVKSAPILVDYEVHFAHTGSHLGSAGTPIPATRAQASVKFGNYSASGGGFIYNGRGVDCSSSNSGVLSCTGYSGAAPTKGTLPSTQVLIGEDTSYFLQILAAVSRNDFPTCKVRVELDGDPCLVDPWSGTGRVVTDPYVYVDPSWLHAALVLVQMAEDEDGTSWVTPQRTYLDFAQMKVTDAPPTPTPGGGEAGAAPPATPSPGPSSPSPPSGDAPGTGPGAASGGAGSDDGGCAVAPASTSGRASGALLLVAGLSLLATRARRRARRLT